LSFERGRGREDQNGNRARSKAKHKRTTFCHKMSKSKEGGKAGRGEKPRWEQGDINQQKG